MNKDRMSNHATFIAAKRQEIASLTAQIETELTRQGDPAVEAEKLEERVQGCRTVVSKGGPGQRERSGSRGTPSHSRDNVPQWRVSPHRRWKSSCQTLDCSSRQAFVVVSIRTVTHRLAMRWFCSMRNLVEMTARSCFASRVSTKSVLRK